MHLKKNKKNKQRNYLNEHIPSPAQTICFSEPPPLPKKNEMKKMPALVGLVGFIF